MKQFTVSMQCTVFATVEVEARDKKEAEAIARKEPYANWDVQKYTLTPETLESVTKIVPI